MRAVHCSLVIATALLVGCHRDHSGPLPVSKSLSVTSPAFTSDGTLPAKYTCDGADVSPPLHFADVPAGTVELALTVEDPDAPGGTFVHWVAWGLDPAHSDLAEGAHPPFEGRNGFGKNGYRGPCPPTGSSHHYVFTFYALKGYLTLKAGATAQDLRSAVDGGGLAEAKVTVGYSR